MTNSGFLPNELHLNGSNAGGTFDLNFDHAKEDNLSPKMITSSADTSTVSGHTVNTSAGTLNANEATVAAETQKPRVLIMGLRRSGKSSIQKVVFHKMSPNETLFLESSSKIVKDDIQASSFVFFTIYNLPGQLDLFDMQFDIDDLLRGCDALVFVIDAQDDYLEALTKLHITVVRAFKLNPNIKFEVFIHKVDCLSDENKIEVQREIHQRVTDDLIDAGFESIFLSFHLTSIYDHSIFEAFSKVVQKLIPQMPYLENILNLFISNSGIDKAFLFDVVSKIYIATDSSPVDMQTYELCCDMIDVVIDISGIYGVKSDNDANTFDGCSLSIIKLNNQTVLYLREVNAFLALVCILREENFDKQGMIDYNFNCFKEAIQEIFESNCPYTNLKNPPSPITVNENFRPDPEEYINNTPIV